MSSWSWCDQARASTFTLVPRTAQEIVRALGGLAGAARAEGLREVIAASAKSGRKKGQMLYDFMAQGVDEVAIAVGDEVIVLDNAKSDEWWLVQRLKNGKESVVPSSYVEIIGTVQSARQSDGAVDAARSTVEQNRMEEECMARETSRASGKREEDESKGAEVGSGLQLSTRNSSLEKDNDTRRSLQRSKRASREVKTPSKSKPSALSVLRLWEVMLTIDDRTRSQQDSHVDRSYRFI